MTASAADVHHTANRSPGAVRPLPLGGSWMCQLDCSDVDELAGAQPEWDLHYDQLGPGRFAGRLLQAQLPGLRLVHEQSNRALRQHGDLSPGAHVFALQLERAGDAIFHGQRVQADDMMVGRGDVLDLVTPAHFALIGLVVDAQLLHPVWEQLYHKPPSARLQAQLVLQGRPGALPGLRAHHLKTLQTLQQLGAASPTNDRALLSLRDDLLIEWLEALPERLDSASLGGLSARRRLVERACELMLRACGPEASGAEDGPLSMLAVCREVGASRRKLNYCFQDVLGTSPIKYLRAVRLNGVRRALRDAEPGTLAVQDAAARWGFWHMGQFSSDYRAHFGERPSDTLRRL